MKKRIFAAFLAFLFVVAFTPSVFAVHDIALDAQTTTEVIYLENGRSLTITLTTRDVVPLSYSLMSSDPFAKTGEKVVTSRDSNGDLEWEYTLFAVFSVVEGVSAVCTSSVYLKTIYQDNWSFSDGDATRSGNTAYGVGVFKRKLLFVTVETNNVNLSISCDVYGNLS